MPGSALCVDFLLSLVLCVAFAVPALVDDTAEQAMVVVESGTAENIGEVYPAIFKALYEQDEAPVRLRLDADVQLVWDEAVVLGASDYSGKFDTVYGEGCILAIPTPDMTIDLNGHILTSSPGLLIKPEPEDPENPEDPEDPVDNVFTDVPADAYYAEAVAWAVNEQVNNGTSENAFSPVQDCNRAQTVTFLFRAVA